MAICLSHSGKSMFTSREPSTELLVGTVDGLLFLRRKRPEDPWEIVKGTLKDKHVVGVTIEPASGTIFACMHNGGIAASSDSGKTWEFRSKSIPFENVYCLNYSHDGGKVKLYAGTEPAHLYVSEDLGKSWTEITSFRSVPSVRTWTFPVPPNLGHTKDIVIHPQNPKVMYVCVEVGAVMRTEDGGATWKELQGTLKNEDCHRLVMLKSNPNKLFLATGYGFYWSTNGGDSWENIGPRVRRLVYPDPLVVHPLNDNVLFMSGASEDPHKWLQTHSADPKIARTRDCGLTWEIVDRGIPEHLNASFEAMSIEAWDGQSAVYVGNTDGEIYGTLDEGQSWGKVAEGLPPVSKTIHYAILRPEGATAEARTTVGGIAATARYRYE